MLSGSDIEKILDKVGVEYMPPDLNRKALVYEINGAWNFYRNYERETSKGRQTALLKYCNRVIKEAKGLAAILEQSSDEADDLRNFLWSARFPLTELQTHLRRLGSLTGNLHKTYDVNIPRRPVYGLTAAEFFLGFELPRIFTKYFNLRATRNRLNGGGPLEGPFITFAVAVSAAFGQHASAETVSTAMTAASKRGLRR